ncbi:MAG: peptidylprolyl isomerase [Candidatus Komeilibacteria bacterium]|nr:peptidylprolyl isomerase [Candidatus Komeilibacteria bacterium]
MATTTIVTLQTNQGDIKLEFFPADAPLAVANFIKLAEAGFYNGVTFHRVIPGFMIQGGDPLSKDNDPTNDGTGGPGYAFADELNPNTVSYKTGYKKGVLAMANSGPNTNGSQFFIMLADYPLPNNYTIFGKVLSGQEVVDKIGLVKTDANDRPLADVKIEKTAIEKKAQ